MDFIERELPLRQDREIPTVEIDIVEEAPKTIADFATAQEYIDYFEIDDPEIIASVQAAYS